MYEKTYRAWEAFEEKDQETEKQIFTEGTPEEQKALIEKIATTDNKEIIKTEQELRKLLEEVYNKMQKLADLTKHSRGHRSRVIQLCTTLLNGLVRNHIPYIFHFPQGEMDKIIRAMEIDRRTEQRRETLEGMPYEDYLQTAEWQSRRLQALNDAHNKCQLCNSTKHLNVHHKTYERRGHELPQDLIVLCQDCHAKHHDKIGKEKDLPWSF